MERKNITLREKLRLPSDHDVKRFAKGEVKGPANFILSFWLWLMTSCLGETNKHSAKVPQHFYGTLPLPINISGSSTCKTFIIKNSPLLFVAFFFNCTSFTLFFTERRRN